MNFKYMKEAIMVNKKLALAFGIGGTVLVGGTVAGVVYMNQDHTPPLKAEDGIYTIEYGTAMPETLGYFSDKFTGDGRYLSGLYLDFENEEGKDYPAVGEYEGYIMEGDEENGTKHSFKVIVKDRKKPVFVSFKEKYEIEQGYSEKLESLFKADDLAKVTISIKGDVDVNKPAEYKVTVRAEDANKNFVEQETVIVVKEKKEEAKPEDNGNSSNTGNVNTGNTNTSNTGNTNTGGNVAQQPSQPEQPSQPSQPSHPEEIWACGGNHTGQFTNGYIDGYFDTEADADAWFISIVSDPNSEWAGCMSYGHFGTDGRYHMVIYK